jgi:phosphate transport system permease protein
MRYQSRKFANMSFTGICVLASLLVLGFLLSLLWTLFYNGGPALVHWHFYTAVTPPPGFSGGLANALIGSLIITALAILIATPVGLAIAVYLSEFAKLKRFGRILRFINNVLLSAPSIVIGLFCYLLLVRPLGHFSAWSGSFALAFIALPIIVRTAEDMLKIVPAALREAALALGAPYWKMLFQIVIKSVYQGLFTGILLALARILGETAPLLFTSLNNAFMTISLNKPMASLPIVIYEYAMSPYPNWQTLAWGGALFITLVVCGLSVLSKFLLNREREEL